MIESIHSGIASLNTRPPLITWVLVADGKQAIIYECHKIIQIIPTSNAHKRHMHEDKAEFELVPVPDGELAAELRGDYELHGDFKEKLKQRFIKALVGKLNKAHEAKLFDKLVLVAPAKMVGELREQLASNAQQCITAVLPKDMMHYVGHELLPYLQDTLTEAHLT